MLEGGVETLKAGSMRIHICRCFAVDDLEVVDRGSNNSFPRMFMREGTNSGTNSFYFGDI